MRGETDGDPKLLLRAQTLGERLERGILRENAGNQDGRVDQNAGGAIVGAGVVAQAGVLAREHGRLRRRDARRRTPTHVHPCRPNERDDARRHDDHIPNPLHYCPPGSTRWETMPTTRSSTSEPFWVPASTPVPLSSDMRPR